MKIILAYPTRYDFTLFYNSTHSTPYFIKNSFRRGNCVNFMNFCEKKSHIILNRSLLEQTNEGLCLEIIAGDQEDDELIASSEEQGFGRQ